MSEIGTEVGKIVQFPSAVPAQTWMDEFVHVIDEGRERGVLSSFVGFVMLADKTEGFHFGNVDTANAQEAYILIGAMEEMKSRLLRVIMAAQGG